MRLLSRLLVFIAAITFALHTAFAGLLLNSYIAFPPAVGGAAAPVITNTATVLTQGASAPFASNINLSTFSKDTIVACGGWGRNASLTFGTTTLGGAAPDGSVISEDNDSSDRAGFACYWWFTTSTSSSVALSIGVASSNPDSWRVIWFGLTGVNASTPTVTTAHSETDSTAAKNVTIDTTGYADNTTVIGGRVHARSAAITCTPTGSITEVSDAGSGSQSMWIGKMENMTPQSLSFGCTGSATDDGDALAAVAFRG